MSSRRWRCRARLCCRWSKRWSAGAGSTRAGQRGKARSAEGRPFTKTGLHRLLTNITCIGKVRYKDETHDGEQPAIVDLDVWQQVQALLGRNGRTGGARNQFGALLKGIVRCVPCGCAMIATHTTRKGNKR